MCMSMESESGATTDLTEYHHADEADDYLFLYGKSAFLTEEYRPGLRLDYYFYTLQSYCTHFMSYQY